MKLLFILAAMLLSWTASAKMGPSLHAIYKEYLNKGNRMAKRMARKKRMKLRKGRMTVLVKLKEGMDPRSSDLSNLIQEGYSIDAVSRSYVRVNVRIKDLLQLSLHEDVSSIKTPAVAKEAAFGSRVSESTGLTGATDMQNAGFRGAGAKVAVIDLGFSGLTNAINSGELPQNTVVVDLPGTQDDNIETGTEHGVGVAEHVMDMAPDATLYVIKVGDELDLENAADYMAENGVQIVNHSVGWVTSSYYDNTGPINTIVNDSFNNDGIFWVVSSGNNANRHWRGTWSDPNGNNRQNFTATDETIDISGTNSTISLFLNWDQYGDSQTDLDLLVLDRFGRVVASSRNTQNGSQDPVEVVSFSYFFFLAPYEIAIEYRDGPTENLDMTLFSFNHDLEHASAASSMMDPANAEGAFSVGAIDYRNWEDANPQVESFSSQGPTNDGRNKPDLVAPDGTTSLTYGDSASFGTSFASPTVAGAAALLLSQNSSLTASQLADTLRSSAFDIGAPGYDFTNGYGQLQLLAEPPEPNTPPTADDQTIDVVEDGSASSVLTGSDADGDSITFQIVSGPSSGVLNGTLPNFTYTPNANFNGSDSFTFTTSDGTDTSNLATVSINVSAVNDAPVANSQSVTTDFETAISFSLSGSDPDGDNLTFSVTGLPTNGVLSGTPPNLTYTPNDGFSGVDGITFEVSDGSLTDSATVSITVEDEITEPPAQIAFDGFESGLSGGTGVWSGSWQTSGDVGRRFFWDNPFEGFFHMRLRNSTGVLSRGVNLAGMSNARLVFYARVDSFEGSDRASVQISSDGVSFTEVASFDSGDSNNTYQRYEVDLSSFAMTSNFVIRFEAQMNQNADRFFIDAVEVLGN